MSPRPRSGWVAVGPDVPVAPVAPVVPVVPVVPDVPDVPENYSLYTAPPARLARIDDPRNSADPLMYACVVNTPIDM